MRKQISILMIIAVLLTALSGCRDKKFPESVKSNLVDGVDYIDHASTYDGKGMSYDETVWYVNELRDVPLPDPHVYVEDNTYYIIGTSDRDGNVIRCAFPKSSAYCAKAVSERLRVRLLFHPLLP